MPLFTTLSRLPNRGMTILPNDLKHYHAEPDAFDLGFSGDQLVILLCLVLFVAYVMKDYL